MILTETSLSVERSACLHLLRHHSPSTWFSEGSERSLGVWRQTQTEKEVCLLSDIFWCEGDLKFSLLRLWQIRKCGGTYPTWPNSQGNPLCLNFPHWAGFNMACVLSFLLSRGLSILQASMVLTSPRNVSDGARKRQGLLSLLFGLFCLLVFLMRGSLVCLVSVFMEWSGGSGEIWWLEKENDLPGEPSWAGEGWSTVHPSEEGCFRWGYRCCFRGNRKEGRLNGPPDTVHSIVEIKQHRSWFLCGLRECHISSWFQTTRVWLQI